MHLRSTRTPSTPTLAPAPCRLASCAGTAVPRCSSSRPSCAPTRSARHRSRRTHHEYRRPPTPNRPVASGPPQSIRDGFALAAQSRPRTLAASSTNPALRPRRRIPHRPRRLVHRRRPRRQLACRRPNPHSHLASLTTAAHAAVSSLEACPTPTLRPALRRSNLFARVGVGQPLTTAEVERRARKQTVSGALVKGCPTPARAS